MNKYILLAVLIAVLVFFANQGQIASFFNDEIIDIVNDNGVPKVIQTRGDHVCGVPQDRGEQIQNIRTKAIFVDNQPYYCKESYDKRNWFDFTNVFVCSDKKLPWYNREESLQYTNVVYKTVWGYDIGVLSLSSQLTGFHTVKAYVQLECPNMGKDGQGYYPDTFVIKKEKVIDFGGSGSLSPPAQLLPQDPIEDVQYLSYKTQSFFEKFWNWIKGVFGWIN